MAARKGEWKRIEGSSVGENRAINAPISANRAVLDSKKMELLDHESA
ncbi:hypothetical protein IB236_02365 [Acidovorax sp. ACV02]|nr:hypothetical protein [Acidovorax sp. ACV02]MBD9404154.1 hypothetical protein [Acidovorax sp. ACV02]